MLEQIKARIAEIEKAMADLVSQHNVLSGHLNEARHLLDLAVKLAEGLAPERCAAQVLEAVDKAVDECADVVDNNEPSACQPE